MPQIDIITSVRPWGSFRQFIHNSSSTVKIITVKKGEAFSLQYHKKRTEFWHIIDGTPEVIIGEKTMEAKPGDEFEILPKIKHRVRAIENDVHILEISLGDFKEDDIVRLEDKYGRA